MTSSIAVLAGRVEETASAKINLALHVTGRREDGYHLLDTLVTFAEDGDELSFEAAAADSLAISGRFGPLLSGSNAGEADNLIIKARDLLRAALDDTGQHHGPVAITLEKNLPVASGIGGGSADAAATLRGLMRLWGSELPSATLMHIALKLGADVPMCLSSVPLRARGIGEKLQPVNLPGYPMVLLNPLKPVSTPEIFRRLDKRANAAIDGLPAEADETAWLAAMRGLRNDLQGPAAALEPEIAEACDLLRQSEAEVFRMSGSGATCFGLYKTEAAALKAALALSAFRPNWYVLLTRSVAGA